MATCPRLYARSDLDRGNLGWWALPDNALVSGVSFKHADFSSDHKLGRLTFDNLQQMSVLLLMILLASCS